MFFCYHALTVSAIPRVFRSCKKTISKFSDRERKAVDVDKLFRNKEGTLLIYENNAASESFLAIQCFLLLPMPSGTQYMGNKFTPFCASSTHYTFCFQNSPLLLKLLPTFLNILSNLQDQVLVNVYSSDNANFREFVANWFQVSMQVQTLCTPCLAGPHKSIQRTSKETHINKTITAALY